MDTTFIIVVTIFTCIGVYITFTNIIDFINDYVKDKKLQKARQEALLAELSTDSARMRDIIMIKKDIENMRGLMDDDINRLREEIHELRVNKLDAR